MKFYPDPMRDGIGKTDEASQIEIILYLLAKWSHLPDLYSFFNHDGEFLRFLSEFGGTTMTIPAPERVGTLFRDVKIWNSLRGLAEGEEYASRARQLAQTFELSENRVRGIFRDVDREIRKARAEMNKLIGGKEKGAPKGP